MNLRHPHRDSPWAVVQCPTRFRSTALSATVAPPASNGAGPTLGATGAFAPASSFTHAGFVPGEGPGEGEGCVFLGSCGTGHPQVVAAVRVRADLASSGGSGGSGGGGAGGDGLRPPAGDTHGGAADVGLVLTDAYPKECASSLRGLQAPGAVPLRLMVPPGSREGPTSGTPSEEASGSKDVTFPEQGRRSLHERGGREVELLQVMVTSTAAFGGLDGHDRDSMAWRCACRAFSRVSTFNGLI